tara:strand:- start:5056 stop:5607 length:552 start_codon:yes stop_codon:yes gene_type:complete
MARRKFEEEEVVEETTTDVTEETVEESPDQHDQFVTILVDMGLSAEQAEAVHSMAMDLIDAGGSEEITEEVTTEEKIEASRQRRARRSTPSQGRRSEMSREGRSNRRQLSEGEMKTQREQRSMRRLRRQNIELRQQLRELGAAPAAPGLRNAPNMKQENLSSPNKTLNKGTSAALDMINNYGK